MTNPSILEDLSVLAETITKIIDLGEEVNKAHYTID